MALGSNGYRAALAKHLLTPVRISSLRGTVGSPNFIFFSTRNPCCWTLPCDVPCIVSVLRSRG